MKWPIFFFFLLGTRILPNLKVLVFKEARIFVNYFIHQTYFKISIYVNIKLYISFLSANFFISIKFIGVTLVKLCFKCIFL